MDLKYDQTFGKRFDANEDFKSNAGDRNPLDFLGHLPNKLSDEDFDASECLCLLEEAYEKSILQIER